MARKSKPEEGDEKYVGNEGGEEHGTEGLPGGRIPNPPPRDPWVSRVVEDPANPPEAVLLSGYVGDAAEEGRTRIYTDASLSSYVEVSDEDVLYHEALGGDQVPEGGSLVWVRSNALVTPGASGGTGTGGAAGGDFFTGPVLEQNRRAGTVAVQQPGPVQITLLTIAGCYTQRVGCTIFGCHTQNLLCRTYSPVICSFVCEQGGGIGQPGELGGLDIDPEARPSLHCPSRPNCPNFPDWREQVLPQANRAIMAGGPIGPTGWLGCGQPHISLPGCIHTGTCPHISLPGCVHTGTCSAIDACPTRICAPREGTDTVYAAAAGPIGPTGWQGCGQPSHLIGCTGWQGCGQPHISLPGCVHTGTCSAIDACPTRICGGREGTDTVAAFAAPGAQAAAPTTQYAPQCPTFGFTCTYVHCPPRSVATVCTQIGCPSFGFTCTAFCQARGGGGVQAGPGGTPAPGVWHPTLDGCHDTVVANCTQQRGCAQQGRGTGPGTQIGCPSFGFTCTAFCQAQGGGAHPAAGVGVSAATVCTQAGCPTMDWCVDTVVATCTRGCAAKGREGPVKTTATLCTQIGCPSFGFTCTVFCQAQGAGGGLPGAAPGGGGAQDAAKRTPTLATVCTQFGCIPRTRLCPHTFQPGCGPDHEHGGSTAATLCTLAPFCPPTAHCPPTMHCTVATVCTQIGCPPPHTGLGCPRTSTCPPTYTPGCGGTPKLGAATPAAAPTGQYAPQCPTFGFTCTYVHCPQVTQGLGCPNTSTCPPQTLALGCPNTGTCPPHTLAPGCPPHTLALGCPNTSTCPVSANCPPPTGACPPA